MNPLERRVERLEAASNGKEVGLGEILHWLYRRYGPRLELDEPLPLTPEEQREYEDYLRRGETSKLVLWLASFRGEAAHVDRLIESESIPAPSPEDAASAFLKTRLGDGKPHPVVQVYADADAAGIDPDALQRARNMLPIATRSGPGRPSTWTMEMDEAPAPPDAARNRLPIEDASPRPTISSGQPSAPEMDISARIAAQQNWLAHEAFVVRNDIGVPATNTGTGRRT